MRGVLGIANRQVAAGPIYGLQGLHPVRRKMIKLPLRPFFVGAGSINLYDGSTTPTELDLTPLKPVAGDALIGFLVNRSANPVTLPGFTIHATDADGAHYFSLVRKVATGGEGALSLGGSPLYSTATVLCFRRATFISGDINGTDGLSGTSTNCLAGDIRLSALSREDAAELSSNIVPEGYRFLSSGYNLASAGRAVSVAGTQSPGGTYLDVWPAGVGSSRSVSTVILRPF